MLTYRHTHTHMKKMHITTEKIIHGVIHITAYTLTCINIYINTNATHAHTDLHTYTQVPELERMIQKQH